MRIDVEWCRKVTFSPHASSCTLYFRRSRYGCFTLRASPSLLEISKVSVFCIHSVTRLFVGLFGCSMDCKDGQTKLQHPTRPAPNVSA